jgi:hypothetical protein
MNAAETPTKSQQPSTDSEPIPAYDRAVLWMFLLGFVAFGVVLIADLITGFFR